MYPAGAPLAGAGEKTGPVPESWQVVVSPSASVIGSPAGVRPLPVVAALRTNRACTDLLASSVTSQVVVLPTQAPVHSLSRKPLAGVAVSVTLVPPAVSL